ncbi:MAG: AI-2E family transporter [Smithellaceae bacterium]
MSENPFANFQKVIFFLILALITLSFGYLLKPFFFAILWAVLIGGIFTPVNNWLNRRIKSPNLCASITLAGVLVCLILPVGLLTSLLVAEIIEIYASVHTSTGQWMETIERALASFSQHPLLSSLKIDQAMVAEKSVEVLKAVSDFLFKNLTALTQNTIVFFVQFAVMLYCLFYFLRDGANLISTATRYMPVSQRHIDMFISQFLNTSKATLKFTFVIGGIQGFLGGMIFYVTGIERALVWGVLMLGLSIVPAIGCSLIWAPAGIIMLIQGHVWQGVTILIFGSVVISSVDNLLRPVLLGKDIQMHALLIFLSTLGGIALFGVSGFVLGPVIASLFLASWKLFLELHQQEEVKDEAQG